MDEDEYGTETDDGTATPYGSSGPDTLTGSSGTDYLSGYGGDDTLEGGGGNAVLDGGQGDDFLSGDGGTDRSQGGTGSDTFAFTRGSGHDTITDFQVGIDRITVSGVSEYQFSYDDDGEGNTLVSWGQTGTDVVLLGVDPSEFN